MDEIIAAIEDALKRKGLSAAAASEAAVGNPALIKNWTNRRGEQGRRHPIESLRLLADVLDLEFYFGPRRSPPQTVTGFAETASNLVTSAIDGSPEALRLGYLPLPFNDRQEPNKGWASIAVARSWLLEHSLEPERLSWIIAPDGAMAPSVPEGALCLIEKTLTPAEPPSISAVWSGGRIVLAHVSRPSGKDWLLDFVAPDAPAYYIAPREAASVYHLGSVAAVFSESSLSLKGST